MARIEAFKESALLWPPNVTESEDVIRKNVQDKINDEQNLAR